MPSSVTDNKDILVCLRESSPVDVVHFTEECCCTIASNINSALTSKLHSATTVRPVLLCLLCQVPVTTLAASIGGNFSYNRVGKAQEHGRKLQVCESQLPYRPTCGPPQTEEAAVLAAEAGISTACAGEAAILRMDIGMIGESSLTVLCSD